MHVRARESARSVLAQRFTDALDRARAETCERARERVCERFTDALDTRALSARERASDARTELSKLFLAMHVGSV